MAKRLALCLVSLIIVLVGIQVGLSRKSTSCAVGQSISDCVDHLGSANEVFNPPDLAGSQVHIFKSTRTRGQDYAIVVRAGIVIEVINIDSEEGKVRVRSLRE